MAFRPITTQFHCDLGQTLGEYVFVIALIAIGSIVALMGFSSNLGNVYASLGGGLSQLLTYKPSPLASSGSSASTSSGTSLSPYGGQSSNSGKNASFPTSAQIDITSAQNLISQINPANLPEVSGASSDVGKLSVSAALLVQKALELEALAKTNQSLDVTELVYNARRLALTQYAQAGELAGGTNNTYNQKAVTLADQLLMQKPADMLVADAKTLSQDGVNNQSNYFSSYIDNAMYDYKNVYSPTASTITQLNLQTQQAGVVTANGGNINTQNALTTSGSVTEQGANAINQCQTADCTP